MYLIYTYTLPFKSFYIFFFKNSLISTTIYHEPQRKMYPCYYTLKQPQKVELKTGIICSSHSKKKHWCKTPTDKRQRKYLLKLKQHSTFTCAYHIPVISQYLIYIYFLISCISMCKCVCTYVLCVKRGFKP